MALKRRPSSQANLLRNGGTPALGTLAQDGNKNTLNPVGFYSPDKDAYRRIWTDYDLNQYCSMGQWDGLPNGLTNWNLNRMLYFRGTLCGFGYGGKVYVLPYTISGEINPYGLPTAVKPITYNGEAVDNKPSFFKKNFKLSVDNAGNEIAAKDIDRAYLLYASIPYSPTSKSPSPYVTGQVIIRDIAETLARININVVVSNKKILLVVKDAAQRDIVQKELEIAFKSDSPFGVITSPLEIQTPQSTSDYNADDLFNTVKNWDAIRCFMRGISSKNFGTEKKERLVSGELAGNEEQSDLIDDLRTELAQLWAEQMNAAFGTHITYTSRAEEYRERRNQQMEASTEINGNGKNKLQEEKEL